LASDTPLRASQDHRPVQPIAWTGLRLRARPSVGAIPAHSRVPRARAAAL